MRSRSVTGVTVVGVCGYLVALEAHVGRDLVGGSTEGLILVHELGQARLEFLG